MFFALTYIAYQGAKLTTTIPIIILALVYWKEILKFDKKTLAKSIVAGLIICSPIIFSVLQGKTGRLEVFSLFSYSRPQGQLQEFLERGSEKAGDFTYYLFHSESLNFARGIFGRWFNHFSGRFLFFEGDWQNPRHSAPNHGMLLLADLILLIAGFVALVRIKSKTSIFVFLWLIFAPLPAALTRDQVHAVRALNMIVPLVLIAGAGAAKMAKILDKTGGVRGVNRISPDGWIRFTPLTFVQFLVLGFYIVYVANFVYFLDAYFVHLPRHFSKFWEYGYKQIVETVTPIQKNYKLIRVQQSYAQPYIYFLFYQQYNPAVYQKQVEWIPSEVKTDVGKIEKVDNICFCPIDWSVNKKDKDTLFVADTLEIPPADSNNPDLFGLIKEIRYLDKVHTAFRIIEIK